MKKAYMHLYTKSPVLSESIIYISLLTPAHSLLLVTVSMLMWRNSMMLIQRRRKTLTAMAMRASMTPSVTTRLRSVVRKL